MSPLIGGRAVKGPADRMLQRLAGGTSPRHVTDCYEGLIDALVVDEADADDLDGLGDVRPIVTRTLMSDDDARRRLAEVALGSGAGMRVAIVGGTGDFGLALAARLVEAGDEVVLGSRDAARAQEKADEVGAAARCRRTSEAVADVELVVLATNASATLETAAALAAAIGTTPVLSVASDLRSTEQLSLAERTQELLAGPVVAGLQSLAAAKLAAGRPDEDAFICGDDADAKALALELAGKAVAGRALDAGPLTRARVLEGLTGLIVSLNKRYKGHAGIRVTGLPEA